MTVCSGIGAPEHAAPWIDWRYQSEIDPFAAAVLRERFPYAVNMGDMTRYKEWPNATIDVLCGGTPCQSFSVAGLRKGLDDPRGNLMLTYLAIADCYKPRWIVWENVPGVLSSGGGRDFASFLGGLGQLGYGWAYRVLDVQYGRTLRFPFAIPQRRRRVFVVGYLGDWRRAAEVLLEPACLSRHPAPRREARQGTAPTLAARTRGGGGLGTDFDLDGGLVASHEAAQPLLAKSSSSHRADAESIVAVANSLRAEGFDASEDGTGRQNLVPACLDVAATINASFGAKMGLENQHIDQGCPKFVSHASSPTLRTRRPGETGLEDDQMIIAVPKISQTLHTMKSGNAGPDTTTYVTICASGQQSLDAETETLIAFDCKGSQVQHDGGGASPTLRAMTHDGSHANAGGQLAVAFHPTQDPISSEGVPHTLSGNENATTAIATQWAVRRLTTTECERLMGFPDNWTKIPWRGKPAEQCPDGRRYKALGNSWGVNCGEYIFDRMRWVESL